MNKIKIRIGTRTSRLAMWQTEWVRKLLLERNVNIEVEIVPVQTLGDRDKATALASLGRTGVFTKEIEDALQENRCDMAVHSFKDLATDMPPGLFIGAVLEREEPWDVLVSRRGESLLFLPPGSVIGTSSLRRRSLLLYTRPDLECTDLRGNVPTRLRAAGAVLDEGKEPTGAPIDATVMAFAGLKRLGFQRFASEILKKEHFIPAPAQGAVAVQIRQDDTVASDALRALDHLETRLATTAERRFLKVMEGGCHMPLGALAEVRGDLISLDGKILNLDGTKMVSGSAFGNDPDEVGERLAGELRKNGGDDILAELSTCLDESNQGG